MVLEKVAVSILPVAILGESALREVTGLSLIDDAGNVTATISNPRRVNGELVVDVTPAAGMRIGGSSDDNGIVRSFTLYQEEGIMSEMDRHWLAIPESVRTQLAERIIRQHEAEKKVQAPRPNPYQPREKADLLEAPVVQDAEWHCEGD